MDLFLLFHIFKFIIILKKKKKNKNRNKHNIMDLVYYILEHHSAISQDLLLLEASEHI